MPGLYTVLDAKILAAVSELGPRNFAKVARRLDIPEESLRYRIRRMQQDPAIFLRCNATVYHTNLGLKKAVALLRAAPGCEQTLLHCLETNEYWIYLSRSYGKGEGCTAIYTIPVEHSDEFSNFIREITDLGIATESNLLWSTCFQPGSLNTSWFNPDAGEWSFQWEHWETQLHRESTRLPFTLTDPNRFFNHADEIDVFILKELEKDATKPLREIARMLKISDQKAFYHYKNHLIGKNLLEGYEIFIHPYRNVLCDMYLFVLTFRDYVTMAKFAMSLLDKHFVRFVGKVLNRHSLLTELYLPKTEFRKFIDTLSNLARLNFLQTYDYVILDLRTGKRQTFSYEFLKGGKWLYDHKKHIAKVRSIARTSLSENLRRSHVTEVSRPQLEKELQETPPMFH